MTKIYPTKGLAPDIIEECRVKDVLRNQCAYILATSQWETKHTHEPVREAYYLGDDAEAYRKKKAYYPYYGRGLVQLTWDYNYKKADDQLGLGGKLLNDLDLALDSELAVKIIIVGMMEGWFTGRALPTYITLKRSDFYNARRVVNGTDKAAEIANLAVAYDEWLLTYGYGVDEDTPAPPTTLEQKLEATLKIVDQLEARVHELERWRTS